MLTNTNTTWATLRARSKSPIVAPTTFMVITPSVGADFQRVAATAAKKDRPPRGVPR